MKKVFYANVFFLILVLLQIFGGYLIKPFLPLLHLTLWSSLVLTQILFLIIPIIIYLIVTKQSPINTLRIKPLKIKDLFFVIITGFLVYPIASFLGLITNLVFHNNVNDVLAKMNTLPLWAMVLVIALTPAICEELTMRGAILSGYKKISINKAAVITGFLFGVLHLNPSQFLYTFVLGIILAYLVDATDSIFASMICHFIFNGINAVISWNTVRTGVKPQDITDIAPAVRNSVLIFFLVTSIISIILIICIIKKLKKDNMVTSDGEQRGIYMENSQNKALINEPISTIKAYSPIAVSVIMYILFTFNVYK